MLTLAPHLVFLCSHAPPCPTPHLATDWSFGSSGLMPACGHCSPPSLPLPPSRPQAASSRLFASGVTLISSGGQLTTGSPQWVVGSGRLACMCFCLSERWTTGPLAECRVRWALGDGGCCGWMRDSVSVHRGQAESESESSPGPGLGLRVFVSWVIGRRLHAYAYACRRLPLRPPALHSVSAVASGLVPCGPFGHQSTARHGTLAHTLASPHPHPHAPFTALAALAALAALCLTLTVLTVLSLSLSLSLRLAGSVSHAKLPAPVPATKPS